MNIEEFFTLDNQREAKEMEEERPPGPTNGAGRRAHGKLPRTAEKGKSLGKREERKERGLYRWTKWKGALEVGPDILE